MRNLAHKKTGPNKTNDDLCIVWGPTHISMVTLLYVLLCRWRRDIRQLGFDCVKMNAPLHTNVKGRGERLSQLHTVDWQNDNGGENH